MKIKVENDGGKVIVSKIHDNGLESTMFKVADGEACKININTAITITGEKI